MKKIITFRPTTIKDEESNLYIVHDGTKKFGAVVSDVDPLVAMKKFKEGMEICLLFQTLHEFETHKGNDNILYVAEYK